MSIGEGNDAPTWRPTVDRRPEQLPRGRHGLDPEVVANSQRSRVLAAMIEVVGRDGFTAARITEVISRAGISRKAFYEHFDDKEQCFVAAYEQAITPLLTIALRAAQSQDAYADRARAALAALLNALAANPAAARVCFVEVLAAGPKAVQRRNEIVREFVREFSASTPGVPGAPSELPEVALLTLVGGLSEVLYQTIAGGDVDALPDLLPKLMYSAVLPVFGFEAAERELARSPRGGSPAG